jgi:hypothetical protein
MSRSGVQTSSIGERIISQIGMAGKPQHCGESHLLDRTGNEDIKLLLVDPRRPCACRMPTFRTSEDNICKTEKGTEKPSFVFVILEVNTGKGQDAMLSPGKC